MFVEDRSAERAIALAKMLREASPRDERGADDDRKHAAHRDDRRRRRRAANAPSFVMVSHVKPDGDTLGAGFALGLALKKLGKRVAYFQQDPVPRNLRFLPETRVRLARAAAGSCRPTRSSFSAT